jgi:hypothetical protein
VRLELEGARCDAADRLAAHAPAARSRVGDQHAELGSDLAAEAVEGDEAAWPVVSGREHRPLAVLALGVEGALDPVSCLAPREALALLEQALRRIAVVEPSMHGVGVAAFEVPQLDARAHRLSPV